MKTELLQLFEGVELSDETKQKVATLFEAELALRTTELETELSEKYEKAGSEYQEYLMTEFTEKTDSYIKEEVLPYLSKYIDLTTEEFIKENKVAIVESAKVEAAEKFLATIVESTTQFNVKIPEGSTDKLAALQESLNAANKRLDEQLDKTKLLEGQLKESKKADTLAKECVGMSDKQKEKMAAVTESVAFVNEEQFVKAVRDLRSAYFPTSPPADKTPVVEDKPVKLEENTYLGNLLNSI